MYSRVVVTGCGCVTPLGVTLADFWDGLSQGRSAVGPIRRFDAADLPVRIAAEVRDWPQAEALIPPGWSHLSLQSRYAVAAALAAVRDAGVDGDALDPTQLGVYFGCGETFPNFHQYIGLIAESMRDEEFSAQRWLRRATAADQAESATVYEPSAAAVATAALIGAQGPVVNCITACASTSQSIGEAAEAIRRGEAEVMVAGGGHSMIHPFGIGGFLRLGTLSRNEDPSSAMRPFDRERDGFVVGEGAAVLVLEAYDRARARGADILGELTGYGCAQDAHRITDVHPDGRGAVLAMQRALDGAQIDPADVDYINAHGTSTVVNDHIETTAIKNVFGAAAPQVPISSTKSMTGHLTTAAGGVEALACLLALRRSVLPPTINYATPDPRCDLDYVPNQARQKQCRHVMSNSLGFGGQNVALVFSAC